MHQNSFPFKHHVDRRGAKWIGTKILLWMATREWLQQKKKRETEVGHYDDDPTEKKEGDEGKALGQRTSRSNSRCNALLVLKHVGLNYMFTLPPPHSCLYYYHSFSMNDSVLHYQLFYLTKACFLASVTRIFLSLEETWFLFLNFSTFPSFYLSLSLCVSHAPLYFFRLVIDGSSSSSEIPLIPSEYVNSEVEHGLR